MPGNWLRLLLEPIRLPRLGGLLRLALVRLLLRQPDNRSWVSLRVILVSTRLGSVCQCRS